MLKWLAVQSKGEVINSWEAQSWANLAKNCRGWLSGNRLSLQHAALLVSLRALGLDSSSGGTALPLGVTQCKATYAAL